MFLVSNMIRWMCPSVILQACLVLSLLSSVSLETNLDPGECDREKCKLPACRCVGTDIPGGLLPVDTPQMVVFTFDDAVNEQVYPYLSTLFRSSHKNPNGCSVRMTLFVSHNWTDYCMVNHMWADGHEIASHSITHRLPISWWRQASRPEWKWEIDGQRDIMVDEAEIPEEEIRGMRSPFLQIGGDNQFKMLYLNGYEYDATLLNSVQKTDFTWPFTLDYPPPDAQCLITPCPKTAYPGLWEVPIIPIFDPSGEPCTFIDKCYNQPIDVEAAYDIMYESFLMRYEGNRSPFVINLHAEWFKKEINMAGTAKFIEKVLGEDDVFLVTVHQMLEWMRNPTPIQRIKTFMPWRCNAKRRRLPCDAQADDDAEEKKTPRNDFGYTVGANTQSKEGITTKGISEHGKTLFLLELAVFGALLIAMLYIDWKA